MPWHRNNPNQSNAAARDAMDHLRHCVQQLQESAPALLDPHRPVGLLALRLCRQAKASSATLHNFNACAIVTVSTRSQPPANNPLNSQ
jgi:hypothetical protein